MNNLIPFSPSLLAAGGTILLMGSTPPGNMRNVPPQDRPNVLFLVVDDLKPTLGCFGDPLAKSPNIDRLAQAGTVFTGTYCQQAVSAPSRVSLFTGMRPDYTGVWDLQTFMRDVHPDILTLPQYLKKNGYTTMGFGKLIHGARNNDRPSWSTAVKKDEELEYAPGFEFPANGHYQSPQAQEAYHEAQDRNMNWRQTTDLMKERGVAPAVEFLDVPDDAYADGAIASAGIEALQELGHSNKPFFLALGFHRPHLPFAAPQKYWDLYEDTPFRVNPFQDHAADSPDLAYTTWGELRSYSDIPAKGDLDNEKQLQLIRAYYSCVSYVDAQIGRVLHTLENLGLAENTIVILWGDHGWHLGDHGLWCKHTNFEQATHAPLIISAPGYPVNQQSPSMAEFIDLFPTITELAHLKTPASLQGKSLVTLLKNPAGTVHEYAISQYPRNKGYMGYSLRDSRYRLTVWMSNGFRSTRPFDPDLVKAVELYDYQEDPMETESKAELPAYQAVRERLMGQLMDYFKSQLPGKQGQ